MGRRQGNQKGQSIRSSCILTLNAQMGHGREELQGPGKGEFYGDGYETGQRPL